MKVTDDFCKNGKWLQRTWVNDKYTWTVSGVLWNNIKERTTPNSATQKREPSYIGSINDFKSFDEFLHWNRNQTGYAMGYDIDSDILLKGEKVYSPETCLLIPPALNRFLQSRKRQRSQNLPMGLSISGKNTFLVRNKMKDDVTGEVVHLVYEYVSDIELGKKLYAESVEKSKLIWIDRLTNSGRYKVDSRVVDFLRNWEFLDNWRKHE